MQKIKITDPKEFKIKKCIFNKGLDAEYYICYIDGTRIIHRTDGPAIEYITGQKEWWINDKRHREDGPAYISSTVKIWYINGAISRLDGPAIEWQASSNVEFFINGIEYSEEEYWAIIKFGGFV